MYMVVTVRRYSAERCVCAGTSSHVFRDCLFSLLFSRLLSSLIAQAEKLAEMLKMMEEQRELRLQRVRMEVTKMKNDFHDKWLIRRQEMIDQAKRTQEAFIANPNNQYDVNRDFVLLKRGFYEPSLPGKLGCRYILTTKLVSIDSCVSASYYKCRYR